MEQLYCHPVIPTWPKKTWTWKLFHSQSMASIFKAQFLSHTTHSKQMRFGRNQQFWDDASVCIFQTRLTYPLCASDLEVIIFSMFFSLQTVQRGYFWLSPACRENASQCIPYFSPFTDWLDPIITHKAIVWNIPLAVAGANVSLTCNGFGGVFCFFWGGFRAICLVGLCGTSSEPVWISFETTRQQMRKI